MPYEHIDTSRRKQIQQNLLECPVCYENFSTTEVKKRPHQLACLHSFCFECLVKIVTDNGITCPLCNQHHLVPAGGVISLPKDTTRGELMDILQRKDCTACDDGNAAVFFCEECGDYLCLECTKAHRRTRSTKSHTLQDIQSQVPASEGNDTTEGSPDIGDTGVNESLKGNEKTTRLLTQVEKQLDELNKRKADLNKNRSILKETISKQFNLFGESLDKKKAALLTTVDTKIQAKLEMFEDVRKKYDTLLNDGRLVMQTAESEKQSDQVVAVNIWTEINNRMEKLLETEVQVPDDRGLIFCGACTTEDFSKITHALGSIQEASASEFEGREASENSLTISENACASFDLEHRCHFIEVLKSLSSADDNYEVKVKGSDGASPENHTWRQDKLQSLRTDYSIRTDTFVIIDIQKEKKELEDMTCIRQTDDSGRMSLYNTDHAKRAMAESMKIWNLSGAVTARDNEICVYSGSKHDAEHLLNLWRETVFDRVIPVKRDQMYLFDSDKWQMLLNHFRDVFPDQINVDIIHDKCQVVCHSTSMACLKNIADAVRIFLRDNQKKTIYMQYSEAIISAILKEKNKINNIKASYSQFLVSVQEQKLDDSKSQIVVSGVGIGLGQVVRGIHELALAAGAAEEDEKRFESDDEDHDSDDDLPRFAEGGQVDLMMYLGGGPPLTKLYMLCMPGDTLQVHVVEGDLLTLSVEALVNSADPRLKHDGGVAKQIVKKGGRSIQEECTNHVSEHGQLAEGEVFCSGAGALTCNHVIHAVGPKWKGGNRNESELIESAVYRSLEAAARVGAVSIAFPVIGAGSFGVPVSITTRALINSIHRFFLDFPRCSLREIYICNTVTATIVELIKSVKDMFKDADTVISSYEETAQKPDKVISRQDTSHDRPAILLSF